MKLIPIGIADEVRAEVARQRLTLKELADRSELSYASISRKFGTTTPNRKVDVEELFQISKVLHVPASELMRRAEEAAKRKQQQLEQEGDTK